jgi:hypothetical protein
MTYADHHPTCRFCRNRGRDQEMVKNGVRHYANFECYLDAGKRIEDLPSWQVGRFPYRLIKDRGLATTAQELTR